MDIQHRLQLIRRRVCDHTEVHEEELAAPFQPKAIVARRLLAYALSKTTAMSLPRIANEIGMRSHGTIHHYLATVEELMETNASHRQFMAELLRDLTPQPAEIDR